MTALERTRMLYRMAKQALAGNPMWADVVHLLNRPLSLVHVAGELPRFPGRVVPAGLCGQGACVHGAAHQVAGGVG